MVRHRVFLPKDLVVVTGSWRDERRFSIDQPGWCEELTGEEAPIIREETGRMVDALRIPPRTFLGRLARAFQSQA